MRKSLAYRMERRDARGARSFGVGLYARGAFFADVGSGLCDRALLRRGQRRTERHPCGRGQPGWRTVGQALVEVFESEELSTLLTTTVLDSPETAREQVDSDEIAAAVIVPAGFTRSIIPDDGASPAGDVVQIEVYANPTRPTSSGIVETVVNAFVNRVEIGAVSGQVIVTQLIENGLIEVSDAPAIGREIGSRQAEADTTPSIALNTVAGEGTAIKFDVLAYMAPGMAMMFLMYVVSNGGRTILRERDYGTLPRLLVSPTTATQVLGGKVLGIFLTGVAQMSILIGASALLFQLNWGSPLAVVVLVLASVFGAVGWGLLITAVAKTPGQVGAIGSAMMLTFGVLGGSFFEVDFMPPWFRIVNKITPNAWSIDSFATLARGGGLADIAGSIIGSARDGRCALRGLGVPVQPSRYRGGIRKTYEKDHRYYV